VLVLAFAREMVVVSGFVLLALLARQTKVRVSWLGKAGTLLQMLALSLFLAEGWLDGGQQLQSILRWFLVLSTVIHFAGGLDYAFRGMHEYERVRRAKRA
jgi:phosphatidylglycerophosphate synthase